MVVFEKYAALTRGESTEGQSGKVFTEKMGPQLDVKA